MNILLEYSLVFIAVYILNYFAFVRGKKKYDKKKIPTELLYLKRVYGVNITKIPYHQFLIVSSLINTFIISTIYIIIMYLLQNIILRIIISVILLILMIIICYGFLAKYYLWKESDN